MDSKITLYVAVVSLFLTVIAFLFFYNEIKKIKKQLSDNKISNNETVSLIQRVKTSEEKINNIRSFLSHFKIDEEEKVNPKEKVNPEENIEETVEENIEELSDSDSDIEVEME